LAEFGEQYDAFRAAGVQLAALAVDPPDRSEAVRSRYGLQFPILCDTERRVVREWGLFNAEERGGIAVPAIFLLDSGLRVLYATQGTVVSRVQASDMLSLVRERAAASIPAASQQPRNRIVLPRLREWVAALADAVSRRLLRPRK
jgi:peroxiredoxin